MPKLKLLKDDDLVLKYGYSGSRMGKGYMIFLGSLILFPGLVSLASYWDISFLTYFFSILGVFGVSYGIVQISGNLLLVVDRHDGSFSYNKDFVFVNFGDTIPNDQLKIFTLRQLGKQKWEFTVDGDFGEVSLVKSKKLEELQEMADNFMSALPNKIPLQVIKDDAN